MKRVLLVVLFFCSFALTGCDQTPTANAVTASAVPTPTPAESGDGWVACHYSFCSPGDHLYWYSDSRENALDGKEWWAGNRSAEFEGRRGSPSLRLLCSNHQFVQAQLQTASVLGLGETDSGVYFQEHEGVTTVRAKADGKPRVFTWPVSETAIRLYSTRPKSKTCCVTRS